ncbi:MAG: hypothetical protein QJR01_10005 [Kyrpidia sp.]|nr:hypothetical protein [Kyrpidia sp.]
MTWRRLFFRAAALAVGWMLILAPATGARDAFETPLSALGLAALLGAASAVLWFAAERAGKKRKRRKRRKKTVSRRRSASGSRVRKPKR